MGCRLSKDAAPQKVETTAASSSSKRNTSSNSVQTFRASEEQAGEQDVLELLLSGTGLSQYIEAFRSSGYDDRSVLLDITEKDILDIESFAGVTILPGHRKRIILASKRLRADEPGEVEASSGGGSAHKSTKPTQETAGTTNLALESTTTSVSEAGEKNLLFMSCSNDAFEVHNFDDALEATGEPEQHYSGALRTKHRIEIDTTTFDTIDLDSTRQRQSEPAELPHKICTPQKESVYRSKLPVPPDVGERPPQLDESESGTLLENQSISEKENLLPLSPKNHSRKDSLQETASTSKLHDGGVPSSASSSTETSGGLSYRHTMDAIEESLKLKIHLLSSTLSRQKKESWVHLDDDNGAASSTESPSWKRIEESVKTTEFQVKKRIAAHIDSYHYNRSRRLQ